MIPRVIHYCWFGGKPKPAGILHCIDTWRHVLQGYEIREWSEANFDVSSTPWTAEAMACGKYAFVSDYVRLAVLLEHGGIYMDTDVEVVKPFDDLLGLPYFIGAENTIHGINTATIGVEPGAAWVRQCLAHYAGRHFVVRGRMDTRVNPELIKDTLLACGYRLNRISSVSEYSRRPTDFNIFPASWFSPIKDGACLQDASTYAIHRYTATWGSKPTTRQVAMKKLKDAAKAILPARLTQYILDRKKAKRDGWFDEGEKPSTKE